MISIIIPTYNRDRSLEQTLVSLYAQKNIAQAEVIVINNGSTDQTASICERYAAAHSNFRVAFEPTPGLLTGRHAGASMAQGSVLAFIDDDVELSHTWLDAITEQMLGNEEIAFMTGPTLPKYEAYPPKWIDYFWHRAAGSGRMCAYLSLLDLGDAPKMIDPGYVWGLNFIVRKAVLHQLGGFHPDCIPKALQQFQGDGESGLTNKARELGLKALYHPGAMLYHVIPATRLTPEYFDGRAFYQGVCDSYSVLRTEHGLYRRTPEITVPVQRTTPGLKARLRSWLRPAPVATMPTLPSEIAQLKERFREKEKEGYAFHQTMFDTQPHVREWVLRTDYFNYQLPQA
jgi:glucosyl-dolichyl phosphate glucuronosyltransferase